MIRDWGAILWPAVPGSRYGMVVPEEGSKILERAVFLAAITSAFARSVFPGSLGSIGAWVIFPLVFFAISAWGRMHYRYAGARLPGRVLVMEDDPASLALMERMLRRRGWDVDAASSLAQGREFLARDPTWIIADVRLPDGSGLDLFRYLKPPPYRPKTIVLTAASDPGILAEIMASGPTSVVYKPLSDPTALLDSLGDP